MTPTYHRPEDVAAMFKVSERVVRNHANHGGWPHERIGKVVRFTDEDIEAIRTMCEVRPATTVAEPVEDEWGTRTRGRAS